MTRDYKQALQAIIDRSHNGELGTSKVIDMRRIAEDALKSGDKNETDFNELWNKFSEISVNDDDEIQEPFMHFEKGFLRFEIWRWFEDKFDVSIGDLTT